MLRTSVADESGLLIKKADMMMESSTMESTGLAMESGLGRGGRVEIPAKPDIPEMDLGHAPREMDLPGSRSAPEMTPGRIGKAEQNDLRGPKEVDFPDSKSNPELKPGDIDVAEEVSKSVPTDPDALLLTVEQGRKDNKPEVGEQRTVVEMDERRENEQESKEDGKKQLEVDKQNGGPDIGFDPRDALIN
jgi:hypothetical protein